MDLVIRAVVVFLFVFAITRLIGRRELNSLEPFDMILLIVLGDLVQQGITQSDNSVTGTLIVMATISILTVGFSYLSFRSKRLRKVLDNEPIVIVRDGEPLMNNLRRERITREELEAEARQQQLSSLSEVRWAVLEGNGKISFIPRSTDG